MAGNPAARRRVLIVAYHYPPSHGSSGIQRTLKFSTYLREFGWEPMILTIAPRAHERVSESQMGEIPRDMVVKRAFGLDTARHLSVRGRYLRWMAQPDRWVSWWPAAVLAGLRMTRRYRPAVIMSTYPIASAHLIAQTLHRLTGLPWVADFRDSMTEPGYPRDNRTWRIHRRLEGEFVHACTRAIFTTQGTLEMYRSRYPDVPPTRWAVIENGFDEENFRDAETGTFEPLGAPGQMVLVHSGILYPQERDPLPLFAALRELKSEGVLDGKKLRLILRAPGTEAHYKATAAQFGIDDIVSIEPSVDYASALREMMRADGLLLMQGVICNHQIPAKLYEYARAGRPILALTDFAGDTARLLKEMGCTHIADMADQGSISAVLRAFIADWRAGELRGVDREVADRHSRKARTAELAGLLDELIAR